MAFWNAAAYDQVNPLVTTEEGFYQWFVPIGEWAVGEATINITSAKNYAGTELAEYNNTISVISAPANIEAANMEILLMYVK